jgi:drug/metabolite transporter (DMT)-like permease
MARGAPDETRGVALVVTSTLAFGVLPILGKLAYAAGVGTLPLLAWRYGIAALLFSLLLRGRSPGWPVRLRLWALGGVFVLNSLVYFIALRTVSASVVALLLYCYPVIVTLLAAAAGLERLTLRSLAVALLAFAGCALAADADIGSILRSSPGVGRSPVGIEPGVLFALAAALIYASYLVISARFCAEVPAPVLAQHLAQVSALVCIGLALANGGVALPPSPRAWLPVLGIALVSTVIALFTFLAGMALVGPTRASVLSSLEVIVTLSIAFVLLGERLGPRQWAGAALILGAVAWQNAGALRALRAGAVRETTSPPSA